MEHPLDNLHLRRLPLPRTPIGRSTLTAILASTRFGVALSAPVSSGTFVYGPGIYLPFLRLVNALIRIAARCLGFLVWRLRVVPLRRLILRGLPDFTIDSLS